MFLSLIEKRRSIRRFEQRAVEAEKIELLVEAALRAPSSRGFNPWRFIVVTDKGLLAELSKAKEHGSSFLEGAPLAIVVCADPGVSDVWVEDASIAAIFIHLAAASMGLGSCWIQIRKRMHKGSNTAENYVRQILGIPENLNVESMVGIGYPAEEKAPHEKKSLQYEKVFLNAYGHSLDLSGDEKTV
jgi:nitroreductase